MTETETPAAPPSVANPLRALAWVPLTLSLEAALSPFTVRDLLHLEPGAIVQAAIPATAAIPVFVNGKLIARARLDVVSGKLAARITEVL